MVPLLKRKLLAVDLLPLTATNSRVVRPPLPHSGSTASVGLAGGRKLQRQYDALNGHADVPALATRTTLSPLRKAAEPKAWPAPASADCPLSLTSATHVSPGFTGASVRTTSPRALARGLGPMNNEKSVDWPDARFFGKTARIGFPGMLMRISSGATLTP